LLERVEAVAKGSKDALAAETLRLEVSASGSSGVERRVLTARKPPSHESLVEDPRDRAVAARSAGPLAWVRRLRNVILRS
jgi:hypothetical protein